MRNRLHRIAVLAALAGMLMAAPGLWSQSDQGDWSQRDWSSSQRGSSQRDMDKMQSRIAREVRHELVMLPYYGVFDNLAFNVQGPVVSLFGQVTQPTLKSDAEHAVRRVEGVERVDNQIEVLPLSAMDNSIRRAEFRAIYGASPLDRYALQNIPPIHIIVKGGHVALEGVVANEMDKNVARIRAQSVPGVFSVEDNLRIAG
jgi:hyperosmotically inducible protein